MPTTGRGTGAKPARSIPTGRCLTVVGGSTTRWQDVAGQFGDLVIGANGFMYRVGAANPTLIALGVADSKRRVHVSESDEGGLSATATLTVIVRGRNDAPVGNRAATAVEAEASTTLRARTEPGRNMLANDTDAEGDALTSRHPHGRSQPERGTTAAPGSVLRKARWAH